jgi:hypothetical protein
MCHTRQVWQPTVEIVQAPAQYPPPLDALHDVLVGQLLEQPVHGRLGDAGLRGEPGDPHRRLHSAEDAPHGEGAVQDTRLADVRS